MNPITSTCIRKVCSIHYLLGLKVLWWGYKINHRKIFKISREIHEDYSLWNYFNYTVLSCPKFKRVTNEGEEMCSPKLWALFQACFQKDLDQIQYIAKCCNLLKRIKGHVLIGFEIYSVVNCIHNSTYTYIFFNFKFISKVHL